jgi:hypothetical protein
MSSSSMGQLYRVKEKTREKRERERNSTGDRPNDHQSNPQPITLLEFLAQ